MSAPWLASYTALWVLVAVLGIVVVSVLRNLAVVYSLVANGVPQTKPSNVRPCDLTNGQTLPEARMSTFDGRPMSSARFLGTRTAFCLVSPTCTSCEAYLDHVLHSGADPLDKSLRAFVVVSFGSPADTKSLLDKVGINGETPVLYDTAREAADRWGVRITPGAIVVDETGTVIRQVFGTQQLMEMRTQADSTLETQARSTRA